MQKRLLLLGLVLALGIAATPAPVPSPGAAAPLSAAAALQRVLTAPAQRPEWFGPALLAQVSTAQMDAIVAGIRAQIGTFERISGDGKGGNYVAIYSGGTIACWISVDAAGVIQGIYFKVPMKTTTSLPQALSALTALPGTVSYVVIQNGRERAAAGQNVALSVGSTFKLAVLNALRDQIRTHQRHWNDVVALRNDWRSLPSGVLQTWPAGTYVTLDTLATEMISISDNTAADTLLHTVGRPALARYGAGNVPFLSTREMFVLKSKGNAALLAAWRKGDARARTALLARLDRLPVSIEQLDLSPSYDDVEWHFTNRQLCALMAGVRDLPLFTVNPGLATPGDWKRISFKGGSDAGVLSMTTWLVAKNGTQYCVSATENDAKAAIDEKGFDFAYIGVLQRLHDEAAAH